MKKLVQINVKEYGTENRSMFKILFFSTDKDKTTI